jgi:hypothetical protein
MGQLRQNVEIQVLDTTYVCIVDVFDLYTQHIFKLLKCLNNIPGANPTTFEFIATTPAL